MEACYHLIQTFTRLLVFLSFLNCKPINVVSLVNAKKTYNFLFYAIETFMTRTDGKHLSI